MPTYEITSPDGSVWDVDAPDGASESDIMAYAQKNWAQPKPEPYQEDMSAGKAALIGAGRGVDKLLSGAKNLYSQATDDQQAIDALTKSQSFNDAAYKPLQDAHPVASFAGEMVPYLAAPQAGGLLGAVATGTALSGLTYGENQGEQAAIGGLLSALPYGIGKGVNKLAGRNGNRLVQAADDMGYKLSPGERLDSNFLKRIEAGMESFPLTSSAMRNAKQSNQRLINKAAAKSIGESTDSLTSDSLGRAATRISDEFNQLTKGSVMTPDDGFRQALRALDDDIVEGLFDTEVGKKALTRLRKKIRVGGEITDAEYQRVSSQISKKLMGKLEGEDREVLSGIKGALDDLVERELSGDKLAKFRKAREQWRNLMTLEKPNVTNSATGEVSGATLANTLARADKHGYTRGHNTTDLYQAARLAKSFRPIVGNSGTADRLALPLMMGGSGYAASEAGVPVNEVLMYAAAPWLLSRGYMKSPQVAQGISKLLPKAVTNSAGKAAVGLYASQPDR